MVGVLPDHSNPRRAKRPELFILRIKIMKNPLIKAKSIYVFTIIILLAGTAAFADYDKDQVIEPTPVVRDVIVTGVAFEDLNGNGKRDAGEKGLENVWITDSGKIQPTKADGSYRLEIHVDEYRMVHITLPAGYKLTSPRYHLIGQDDTATEYNFDFALQPDPISLERNFPFVVTADSQFASARQGALLKANFKQINEDTSKPRFHITAGDLTLTGWKREWDWYADAKSVFTIPNYEAFGGHGGNYGFQLEVKEGSRKKGYLHHFNIYCGPSWHSFNYGGRHFIIFNNHGYYYTEDTKQRQKDWLKAEYDMLEPGTEIVFISHYANHYDDWRDKFKIVAHFYGHYHDSRLYYHKGTPYMCQNGFRGMDWGVFNNMMRLCRFEDDKLITDQRVMEQYNRLEIINPPLAGEVAQGKIPLRILAYNTSTRVKKVDVCLSSANKETSIKVEQLGQWTWGTTWDTTKVKPGLYTLKVNVTDDTGQSWSKESPLLVKKGQPAKAKPGQDWPSLFKSYKELRTTKTAIKPPLELVWSARNDGRNQMCTSPIVYRKRVYVGAQNTDTGNPRPMLSCFDAATGKLIWKKLINATVYHTPAAAKGRVFVSDGQGGVHAFDWKNGKLLWKIDTGFYNKGPVMLDGDNIIVSKKRADFVIIDQKTGEIVKEFKKQGGKFSMGTPYPDGDILYLAMTGQTRAINRITGEEIWKVKKSKLAGGDVSTPILHDGVLYQTGRSKTLAFDVIKGELKWKADTETNSHAVSTPTVSNGVLYSGGRDFLAIDIKTGNEIWRYESKLPNEGKVNRSERAGGSSSCLVSGDVLYYASDEGYIYAFDKKTGKELWKYNLGMPIKSSPVVSGNMYFITDWDGNLHAFVGK